MWSADFQLMERYTALVIEGLKYGFERTKIFTFNVATKIVNSPQFQNIAAIALWKYCQMTIYLTGTLQRVYDNNELIRVPTDACVVVYKFINKKPLNKRVEPDSSTWIHIASSTELKRGSYIGDSPFKYSESYDTTDYEDTDLQNTFDTFCQTNKELDDDNKDFENSDTVIMIKRNDLIVVRVCASSDQTSILSPEASSVRFLSVEYVLSGQPTVVLNIPKEIYVQGNQLFTPAFVRRCLEYQEDKYVFSDDYILRIMDNEIKQIELDSKQYVVLGKDDYSQGTYSGNHTVP
jgi:hypothetical protein